jgi:NADPH:quinone reductase-like Zn-dependent oxidoreductase
MGIIDGQKTVGRDLGCECTGVVRNVGPQVTQLKPGDRVMVFSGGSFTTRLKTKSSLCTKMPEELSYVDGATMPCVYSTVIRSLLDIGRLERHQVSRHIRLAQALLTDKFQECFDPLL